MRLDRGRFTVVAYPADVRLARTLLDSASVRDTFPGLPRPRARALIAVAPDARRFREWVGPAAPEWGAAIAIPDEQRIVMQGGNAGSDAGNPFRVLRHELAHLALHEYLDDRPPRWFDEGYASYAAAEWGRDDALATNISLALHGVPPLDSLDAGFESNASRADATYALSYRAVADLASLDPQRGLALFFRYWNETGSMDVAIRRAYGLTEAAFEAQWRSRTMHRYGILALLANVTVIMALLGFVIVPLYVVRLHRRRRALAAMLVSDAAAERAARASALAALLANGGTPDVPGEPRQTELPPS